jgi:hypothetical protein
MCAELGAVKRFSHAIDISVTRFQTPKAQRVDRDRDRDEWQGKPTADSSAPVNAK